MTRGWITAPVTLALLMVPQIVLAQPVDPHSRPSVTHQPGVVHPDDNIDPGMRVTPPPSAARTPVIHPRTRGRTQGHTPTVIVPK